MATVLSLSDGTTTIDLNSASTPGIQLEEIRLPAPARVVERVASFPFAHGQRTVASGLDDTTIEIRCVIRSTTTDDVEARYLALVRLLEQANRWEESRTGAPVRLAWKRDGATNTAYRVVTNAPAPTLSRAPDWLPAETTGKVLHLQLVLTVEPTWHAGALSTVKAATAVTNGPGSGATVTTSTTTGDMDGPLAVEVALSSVPLSWVWCYLAQPTQTPVTTNFSGTADANASGGSALTMTITGTAQPAAATGGGLNTDTALSYPIRHYARLIVTSGVPSRLQLRWYYELGSEGSSFPVYGPWTAFSGESSGQYWLQDVGAIPALTHVRKRANLTTLSLATGIQLKTSDGSTVGLRLDYIEAFPYRGLVHANLQGGDTGDLLSYEDTFEDGTFAWRRSAPVFYRMSSARAHAIDGKRFGRLAPLTPNTTHMIWVNGQSAAVHAITDTMTVKVDHLPCYALGLRGAG